MRSSESYGRMFLLERGKIFKFNVKTWKEVVALKATKAVNTNTDRSGPSDRFHKKVLKH